LAHHGQADQADDELREFPVSFVFWKIWDVDYAWIGKHLGSEREEDPWERHNIGVRTHKIEHPFVTSGYSPEVLPDVLKALAGPKQACIRRYIWRDDDQAMKEWLDRRRYADEASQVRIDEAIALLRETMQAVTQHALNSDEEPKIHSN
jgi:hypothetical protein